MDHYAVMGNPIKHSKSPIIHREFALQTDQTMTYQSILVPEDSFPDAVFRFRADGGCGLNVTVPFKQQAFALANELSDRAARAQAVNTLTFLKTGMIRGDNTDGVGLVRDIVNNHDGRLAGKTVLVLGAGGAVRGVLAPLLAEGPGKVIVANRTFKKAHDLIEDFRDLGRLEAQPFSKLGSEHYDWVINGTSASLQGSVPDLPPDVIQADTLCYDMMYGAELTPFNAWALERGALAAYDGLGMLVEQAAEAFRLWRGVTPNTAPVIAKLRAKSA